MRENAGSQYRSVLARALPDLAGRFLLFFFSNPGFYCLTPGNFPAEWAKRRTTRTREEGAGGERGRGEGGGREGGWSGAGERGRGEGRGGRGEEREEGGREREKRGKESKQEPTLDSKAQSIGANKTHA